MRDATTEELVAELAALRASATAGWDAEKASRLELSALREQLARAEQEREAAQVTCAKAIVQRDEAREQLAAIEEALYAIDDLGSGDVVFKATRAAEQLAAAQAELAARDNPRGFSYAEARDAVTQVWETGHARIVDDEGKTKIEMWVPSRWDALRKTETAQLNALREALRAAGVSPDADGVDTLRVSLSAANRTIAELEAARQPAPLPEGWERVDAIHVSGPGVRETMLLDNGDVAVFSEGGEAEVPAAVLRALLSLPAPSAPASFDEGGALTTEDPVYTTLGADPIDIATREVIEQATRTDKKLWGREMRVREILRRLVAPSAPAMAPNVARALEWLSEVHRQVCAVGCGLPTSAPEYERMNAALDAIDKAREALTAPVAPTVEDAGRAMDDAIERFVDARRQAPVAQAAPIDEAAEDRAREAMIEPTSANKLAGRWAAPATVGRAATYAEIVATSKALKAEHQAAPTICTCGWANDNIVPDPECASHNEVTFVDGSRVVLKGPVEETYGQAAPREEPPADELREPVATGDMPKLDHAELQRWVERVRDDVAKAPAPSLARLHALATEMANPNRGYGSAEHGYKIDAWARELREALAAGAELPELPSGWTVKRVDGEMCYRSADGDRVDILVRFGTVDASDTVRATELHAVLAHHLAHASKEGA